MHNIEFVPSQHHQPTWDLSLYLSRAALIGDICRNDEWNSDRPSEERKYDGPAGMDPDGVIDSNWEEVRLSLRLLC